MNIFLLSQHGRALVEPLMFVGRAVVEPLMVVEDY